MARLADIPEPERTSIASLTCKAYDSEPWAEGPPLDKRRVALVSTAGLQRRGDRPFDFNADDYRVIPRDVAPGDLVMSHISSNYDRTGFQQDLNVVFPLERLKELAAVGDIGSVAEYHYSFMGATDPEHLEAAARGLAGLLKADKVDAVVLIPV